MNIDGSGQTNLTNNPARDGLPDWSPAGERNAFVCRRSGNAEIYIMKPEGTDLKQLTDNSAADTFSSWSRDGQRIVFVSNRDGNSDIYVMNADGSEQASLTRNLPRAYHPNGHLKVVILSELERNLEDARRYHKMSAANRALWQIGRLQGLL